MLSRATLPDLNGNAVRDVPAESGEGELTVELPPEAMYVVLRQGSLGRLLGA